MFIVIEKGTAGVWGWATIVTNEEGNTKVFDTIEEAQAEADECQDGIVVGDELVNKSIKEELEEIKELVMADDFAGAVIDKLDKLLLTLE